MAIEIKQSPWASALSQGISQIPSAIQGGYDRNLAERQFQLSADEMAMRKLQFKDEQTMRQLEMAQYAKSSGMDAGGYGNVELANWLTNMGSATGTFEADASVPGGMKWTGEGTTGNLMSENEAWNEYKNRVDASGKTLTTSDRTAFEQAWARVVEKRHMRFSAELSKLEKMGYDADDVKWILDQEVNHGFRDDMGTLMSEIPEEFRDTYSPFVKGKQPTFQERMIQSGPAIGVAGMFGSAGMAKLGSTSDKIIKAAQAKFDTETGKTKTKVTNTQTKIDDLKKTKPKTTKNIAAKETKLDKLKKQLSDRKSRHKRNKSVQTRLKNRTIGRGQWYKRFKLNKPLPKLMGASLAGDILSQAGKWAGGTRGEALGYYGGAGIQGLYAGVKAPSTMRKLLKVGKMLGKRAVKRAPRAGAMAMADSPWLPVGDALGLMYLVGGGLSDLSEANKLWKQAGQGR